MLDSSIPAILRERASLQPNDPAFTFIDYDTVLGRRRGDADLVSVTTARRRASR